MRNMFRTGKLHAVTVGVIAMVIAISGGAYAATGGGSTMITICVHHSGVALYQARKCSKRDGKLRWSRYGVACGAAALVERFVDLGAHRCCVAGTAPQKGSRIGVTE
jgi:hypothetical protein